MGELDLCWQQFGSDGDPPLLMIMGLGAQMILWPDELCELIAAEGFRVIRFDNRDSGRSTILADAPTGTVPRALAGDIPEGAYSLSDMAADAAGLLDVLGIEAAHIVGSSLGGMIAQTLAIEHPERVLSLASIMSTTGDSSVGGATQAGIEALTTVPPPDREGYIEALLEARRKIGSSGVPVRRGALATDRRARLGPRLPPQGDGPPDDRDHPVGRPDRAPGRDRRSDRGDPRRGRPLDRRLGREGDRRGDSRARSSSSIPGMGHDLPAGVWEQVAGEIVANARSV